MPAPPTRRAVPIPLVAGLALFLVAIAYLLASSLTRRRMPEFAPTPAEGVVPARAEPGPPGHVDTITIDARDDGAWTRVDLDRAVVLAPRDTAGWDIAARRHRLIVADAVADMGPVSFDGGWDAPAAERMRDAAADSGRAVIGRWYDYGMLSHLLEPNGHVYVVRSRGGALTKLQILSYYCPGMEAGCLTIRSAPLRAADPGAATASRGSASKRGALRRSARLP